MLIGIRFAACDMDACWFIKGSRLGAAVTFQAAKVKSRDAMLAESAFECEPTV
jgi:hypothetical protein